MSTLEKPKNPSLFFVLLFSIPMVLIGALLGFTLLASVAPEPFESVAEYHSDLEESPKQTFVTAHYFRGVESPDKEWIQKRRILLTANNTSVILTNSEINAWFADKFVKPQVASSGEEEPDLHVVPGVPNFLIDANEGVHFSMLLQIVLYGKKIDTLLIGKGYFSEDDSSEFKLSELRLNEAKIPFSEKLYHDLLDYLLGSFYENEEFVMLKEAWEKIDSVELVESGIRLNLD